ncbi:transglutaminase family protein [Caulobacter sp. D4A]|uniref:transglutaminase-like domain-containing protein n=1 Tax=unclassified Caulobacter TaxID=2648921 RepID=UPI000D73B3C1|nr:MULTISPECIES: transglutaminase family protein [unclassified Caulobacter]PXA89788.1 transglutaminase family protein [Caulobacter sp. D4A]PXA92544.1 transglutaminase family protein [Caulobacter sp. D5]
MRLSIDCRLRYEVRTPTSFILAIQAADGADQAVLDETILLPPGVSADFFVDAFAGNRFIRFLAQPGPLDIGYIAQVERRAQVDQRGFIGGDVVNDLPATVLPYLNPSRYCPSDRLTAFARQTFGARPQGLGQVQAIADWIAATITYEAGTSSDTTSAIDTLVDRKGVCRDFAHIGIALCRALDMPARFASCYALDLQPADFHAVFQVYLDGAWRTFDATRRAPLGGLVPIGFGRDAADVPFAATFGDARFEAKSILVTRADEAPAA